jgi:hypothetical protein
MMFILNRHSAQRWLSGHSAKTSLSHVAAQLGHAFGLGVARRAARRHSMAAVANA